MIYRFKLIVPLTYKDIELESEEVELNDQEIALIKHLANQCPCIRYGLMPILKDGAPEIYEKIWMAIEQPLRDVVLEDGRKNGFIDDENEDGELDIDCVNFICKIPDFVK